MHGAPPGVRRRRDRRRLRLAARSRRCLSRPPPRGHLLSPSLALLPVRMEEGVPTDNHLIADEDSEFEEAPRCRRGVRDSRRRLAGPQERRSPRTLRLCTILQACGAVTFSGLSLVCLLVATSDEPAEAVNELVMLLSASSDSAGTSSRLAAAPPLEPFLYISSPPPSTDELATRTAATKTETTPTISETDSPFSDGVR